MPTRGSVSVRDHENEPSGVLFWVQDVGAANYASVTQDIDEVKDAIDTIILGTIREAGFSKDFPESAGFPSGVPNAQRETKWLVTYQDNMQFLDEANTIANPGYLKIFTTEIPCADLSLLPAGEDELDISAGVGLAFKGVWEANVRTPYNHTHGHVTPPATTNTLISVKHMGKNT